MPKRRIVADIGGIIAPVAVDAKPGEVHIVVDSGRMLGKHTFSLQALLTRKGLLTFKDAGLARPDQEINLVQGDALHLPFENGTVHEVHARTWCST